MTTLEDELIKMFYFRKTKRDVARKFHTTITLSSEGSELRDILMKRLRTLIEPHKVNGKSIEINFSMFVEALIRLCLTNLSGLGKKEEATEK